MKFFTKLSDYLPGSLRKFLLVMRFVILFLITGIMQVSATSYAQKITLTKKNIMIRQVFKEIKNQTGYDVLWQRDVFDATKLINVRFKEASLQEVLNDCLEGQRLAYTIDEHSIIIQRQIKQISQSNTIRQDSLLYTGRVMDENGNPLAGANVRIKNTTKGVVTNSNGQFSIYIPGTAAILYISYIGYINQEIPVAGNNSKRINVQMTTISGNLKEVNVVSNGYQDIPKERATGSFEVITAKQLQHSTDPNLLKRLEGITTSINFNNNLTPTIAGQSTLQGQSSLGNITIRGKNTLNTNNNSTSNTSGQPLLVIDGIASAYDITQINPNDVESVTILKDAAAASIWGSRAANGVIVVKTKQGNYERPLSISFNSNFNITEKPNLFYRKTMSTSDFINAQREQFIQQQTNLYSPTAMFPQPVYSPVAEIMDALINQKTITEVQANAQLDALRSNDVRNDITKYMLRNSLLQSYSLGIDGGSKKVSYRLSGGYDNALANINGYKNDRITLNYSSSIKLLKNLELIGVMNYIQQNQHNQAPNTSVGTDAGNFYPYTKLADTNGDPLAVAHMYRPSFIDSLNSVYGNKINDMTYKPLDEINQGYLNTKGQGININITTLYRFNSGFSANVTYSYNRFRNDQETYYSKDSYYMRELVNRFTNINATNGTVSYGIPNGGYDALVINTSTINTLRGQLNYNKTWNRKHSLNAIAGIDLSQSYSEYNGTQYYGYDPNKLSQNPNINYNTPLNTLYYNLSFQNTDQVPIGGFLLGYNRNRTLSSYANASYTYNDRYTVSGSIRRDGSSTFSSTTNKSGTPFYSLGTSWNIANESFYNFDWLPKLQLRSTYGYNGNTNPLLSPRARIARVNYGTGLNGLIYDALKPDEATNNNYRPERTAVLNFGLDYGVKNGRLSGSFEYYIKNTKDLITANTLDPSTGFSSLQYNTGDLHGYGVDMTINSENLKAGKFSWRSNLLLSYNRVKVSKLYVPGVQNAGNLLSDFGPSSYTVGYDLSRLFAYPWAGLDPQTGSPRTYLNGKLIVVNDTQAGIDNFNALYYSSKDNVKYMGSAVPVYFGSLRNTFSYGAFSISANILYKFKYFMRRPIGDLSLSTRLFDGANGNLIGAEYANRWQKPGDENFTNVPSLTFPVVGASDALYQSADINVIRADHIRLQEINLSYSFSNKNWFLKNPRIYANISNLGIIWRANKFGIDPDINDVPQPRTYSFGLSANF